MQLTLEGGGNSLIDGLKDLLKVLQSLVPLCLPQRGCVKYVKI